MMDETHIVNELIRGREASEVIVDEDSFIEGLVSDDIPRPKPGRWRPYVKLLRFVLIIATLLFSAAFVLRYSFLYLKDVLFYNSEVQVNKSGVLMHKAPQNIEYALFLFNTSDLWADTGIRIAKDDYIRISISGAFHSSFGDLVSDARNNNPSPEVRWIDPNTLDRSSEKRTQKDKDQWCIYNKYRKDSSAVLGDVLFSIAPEYVSDYPLDSLILDSALVWKQNKHTKLFPAGRSGILRLAVNDIYFKDSCAIADYAKKNDKRYGNTKFDAEEIVRNARHDSVDFRKIFYIDNVGQMLVCVEIQHPMKSSSWNPMTAFRDLDNAFGQYLASEAKGFRHTSRLLGMAGSFVLKTAGIFLTELLALNILIIIFFLLFFLIAWCLAKIWGILQKTGTWLYRVIHRWITGRQIPRIRRRPK